jgi:hypothetical protein
MSMMKKGLIFSMLLICFGAKDLKADQSLILDRKVTIKVLNKTVGSVLDIISETAKFTFSYSNHVVKESKLISIHAENRTVREVLDEMFNKTLTYQQIGNHLVLQKKIERRESPKAKTNQIVNKYECVVNGYIRDSYSGDGLSNVSLYSKQTLNNTLSGDFGYYKLSMMAKSPEYNLTISHPDYRDTTIVLSYDPSGVLDINISLVPKVILVEEDEESLEDTINKQQTMLNDSLSMPIDSLTTKVDTTKTRLTWDGFKERLKVEETNVGKKLVGTYQKIINRNINDTFNRAWQVTLVPPIGTNGAMSGLVTNRLSYNVLLGYNGGVDGAEFGGFVNIVRQNVRGAQFSGFANVVGGNVEGAQFAGFYNQNIGDFRGFQGSGFMNLNLGQTDGAQFAGFMNLNRKDLMGVQGAGFMNLTGSKVYGVQMAGFMNMAKEVDGGQISGFINVARRVRGFQIGIVNVADTSEGFCFGLVNFIRTGIHQIEFSMDELNRFGLSYRSGNQRFYSVLSTSINTPVDDNENLFGYGYAFGYRAKLAKPLFLTADLGAQHLAYNFESEHLNLHSKLSVGLELRLFKGLSIFGTGTLNHGIYDTADPRYTEGFSKLVSNPFWTYESQFVQKAWLGYQFGLRIL